MADSDRTQVELAGLTATDFAKSAGRLVAVGGLSYGVMSGLQAFGVKLLDTNLSGLILFCSVVLNIYLGIELVFSFRRISEIAATAKIAGRPSETPFPGLLVREIENLRGLRDYARILRYREAFSRMLWVEGYLDERIQLGEAAEDAAIQTGNGVAQAAALVDDLGWTNVAKKQFTDADRYVRHGLAVAREQDDAYWQAKALRHLGGIAARQDRHVESYKLLEEALIVAARVSEELVRNEMIAGIEHGLAECAYRAKDFTKALDHLDRSATIREQVGDATRIVRINSLKGRILLGLKETSRAKDEFRRGLRSAKELGRRDEQILNLFGLARVASLENRDSQAAAYRSEVDQLLEESPAPGVLEEFKD